MINDFEVDELNRIDSFQDNENVGYREELLEMAQRYQANWGYEKNSSITPVF